MFTYCMISFNTTLFTHTDSYDEYGRLTTIERGPEDSTFTETFVKAKQSDGSILSTSTSIMGHETFTQDSSSEGKQTRIVTTGDIEETITFHDDGKLVHTKPNGMKVLSH